MKISNISVELIDHMGSDLSVVNAARVSFHKKSDWDKNSYGEYFYNSDTGQEHILSEQDAKLISYLAKHNHWSPFAHAFASFRIKAPIFLARQLVKHQVGLAWNEVSRRYVDEEPEFFFPPREKGWRSRPKENVKQGSGSEYIDVFEYGNDFTENIPQDAVEVCLEAYKRLLEKGVAPEQARMILPQNMMTEWWWTGSLAAWSRVINLRLDLHTQQETRDVVQQMHDQLLPHFPNVLGALTT